MKKLIITAILATAAVTAGWAQEHLPGLRYSKEPAVLKGCVINEGDRKSEYFKVNTSLKFNLCR